MNVKIDFNKIITTLMTVVILGGFGFFLDFQNVKGEVEGNTRSVTKVKKRVDLIAYLICEDKFKENKDNAPKLCLKLLAQFDKNEED